MQCLLSSIGSPPWRIQYTPAQLHWERAQRADEETEQAREAAFLFYTAIALRS
jgi:hypothetical protein